jgi:CRISPR-associated protein Csb2
MFALEVTFLTGRYVATALDDRNRGEWPPHPARFFSALAATYFESAERSDQERTALEWLERLGAPEIAATDAQEREAVTVFVPVNDTSVVASLDEESDALAQAIEGADHARGKPPKELASAEKKVVKARARFLEAVRREIAPVAAGKEGKDGPDRAAAVLPEHRVKQPRTFPSVRPADPRVTFVWPAADPTADQCASIDALSSRVVRLGHSASLVSVRVRQDAPATTWVPDTTGEVRSREDERVLRIVEPGQLAALEAMPAEQADEPGRVMPASFLRYVRSQLAHDDRAPTSVFGQDWIVLRRVHGPRLPSTRGVDVARTVRKALLQAYGPEAPEVLSGHMTPGQPSKSLHVALVPLPFVGHDRADGSILGVAIVLPAAATKDEKRAVFRAVEAWRTTADDGRLPVHLGRAGSLVLELLEETAGQSTLRASTWCSRARSWATATPIALDRNPGDLRSRDPAKEQEAYAAAEETIAISCERIGLPRPARVIATPAAPLAGGDKVRHFPPFQAGTQRVLVHAKITFERAVEGPILLGAGRYFGLGLLRPVGDHG